MTIIKQKIKETIISAKNCCKTMEMELTAWKAIIYGISRKMENASPESKGAMFPHVSDIHILIEEMDTRIEQIRENCTPKTGIEDIKTEWEQYDHALSNVRMKAYEAMQVLSAGSFGG